MPNLVTWNMRGSNALTDQKWATGVRNMLANGADILCLQECGAPPDSAQILRGNLAGNPNFTLLSWGGTTRVLPIYISYFFWDIAGNRVNYAIVSKAQPAGYACRLPNGGPLWRPFIGVALNNVYYFCIHAISPNGADAPGLLAAAALAAVNPQNLAAAIPWFVAGDYNRAAQGQPPLQPGTYCPPNGNTYPTNPNPTRCYDYMYSSNNQPVPGIVQNLVISSDHFPVWYTIA
jgi:cytolethal distending toxin subunit B